MPQMSPMDWFFLFNYFLFIYYLIFLLIYFNINILKKSLLISYNNNNNFLYIW